MNATHLGCVLVPLGGVPPRNATHLGCVLVPLGCVPPRNATHLGCVLVPLGGVPPRNATLLGCVLVPLGCVPTRNATSGHAGDTRRHAGPRGPTRAHGPATRRDDPPVEAFYDLFLPLLEPFSETLLGKNQRFISICAILRSLGDPLRPDQRSRGRR